MTRDHYILDEDGEPKVVDLMTWAKWFEKNDKKRRIDRTIIGKVKVSTVFLGLDHNYGDGDPLLFETMVFGGTHDQAQDRYHTKEQALAGHKDWVKKIKAEAEAFDRGCERSDEDNG